MPSAPSRFEVEHLHRLMIQASVDAAQLEQRLDEARQADSLWPVLRHWSEAAETLDEAVERARPSLQREGTPKDQIDRIRERFGYLEQRSSQFDLDFDLDDCVETWSSLGHDFAQLSGLQRDPLVRLLQHHKPAIDRATAMLSEARLHEGLLQEQHRKVTALQAERDRARAKYQRLRQAYLEAQGDWEAAQRRKAEEAPAQQHEVKKPPLPDLHLLPRNRPGPVIVRLPIARQGEPELPAASPRPAVIAKPLPPPPGPVAKKEEKKPEARKPRGPAKIALERIERVAGYPTSQDGIGRGGQTASVWFRADHLEDVLFIQGTSSIQLGCGTHLDVMPSVQIFSEVPGQPVRGKVSLLLIASGGRLAGVTARSAQTGAMLAAAAGASPVVARLGAIGKALQGAIREVIEDAAAKVFSRAQPQARPHSGPRPQGAAEHHVARFDHALGPLLIEARAIRGAQEGKLQLHRLLERDHQHRDVVAARLEKTLSHLATAAHRTLTDAGAGQLRAHLAQMDSVLARLHGKTGDELLDGARAVGSILQRMDSVAARAGGASHIPEFRRLIEERKAQLHRIARDARPWPGAGLQGAREAKPDPGHQLRELRRSNPGLDRLLRHSSQAQLAAELSRRGPTGLNALADKPQSGRAALGSASLGGGFQALGAAHLGGFGGGHRGGLGALAGTQGALGKALARQLEQQLRHGKPEETERILGGLRKASPATALHELAAKAELKRKQLAARAVRKGPRPSQVTAAALLDVFREHPKGSAFAGHLAPSGPLRALCEVAQRGHGLPIGQAAQHYLASRGSSQVWNAVATFNTLIGEGHRPRFSLGSWLKNSVSDHVSHALQAVSQTVSQATRVATSFAGAARQGISSFANGAIDMGRRGGGAVRGAVAAVGRGALHAAEHVGRSTLGTVRQAGNALAHVASGGFHAALGAASWAQRKAGGAAHWTGEKVHSGLEWARKTGVVGAVGTGLRKGLSFVKRAAEHTPLGSAVKKGYGFVKSGGLTKVWNSTRHVAGQAWGGLKSAYQTTSRFLQSPAGQLLVTGLSLAASFIPGGIVVKAVIGAGIGAMQAISEGKDWKAVLASAAGGALTGAIPFLKLGPLAKIGVGALQGGITALASGGSLKDSLKGAAGGALDAFEPGAFHALKKLKGFTAAEKLLKGRNLSRAERQLLQSHKLATPLRALEKAMSNPQARRTVGALEKAAGKGVKGGIWVSGKAARAQRVLDKVVGVGDKVQGALSQVHDLAPGLADVLGDNAAGHLVSQAGDWAGQGDGKLQRALGYGHAASDTLSSYRGYLDKGLGFAGVKDPAKAYEKMMARKDLRAGKRGSLEHVAQLKLEDHRRKHPELHLAEATRKRGHPRPERTALEQAVVRGRKLVRKGRRVAQGVHDGLGKVHDVVEKGLSGAEKVQSGLELAIGLARQGAGVLGEDSELGQYLADVADRAGRIHGHLETGIGLAQDFNRKVGATHDAIEKIPGIRKEGEHETATHLEGGRHRRKSPHDAAAPEEARVHAPEPHESEEQRSARLRRAWDRMGSVSAQVQKFEAGYGKSQRKIQELLHQGQANAASTELMALGSRCEEIARSIREAKTLAKGNDKYEKEIAFYEDWHRTTKAKLHAAIADTKGLGGQVAISGFGIQESTHPDIFENTRAIYAVRTKVESFGGALHDPEAAEQVEKVLAEAKKAKAGLQALKAKYRKDKAACDFLTAGGIQDKLIDEALRKLEGAGAKVPGPRKPPPAARPHGPDPVKSVQHGLQAIGKYKKKAIKAGKRIDSGLEKMENALDRGIGAGRKLDSGLEGLAGLADQVSQMLGEESELGQLAHQVGEGAGKGHEKLHQALGVAQTGDKFLRRGHEILHQGLEAAQGHHAKHVEKVHGKKPAHAGGAPTEGGLGQILHEGRQLGHDAGTLRKEGRKSVHDVETTVSHGKRAVHDAASVWDHLEAHDWKGAWNDGKRLFKHGKQLLGDGKELVLDAKTLWGQGRHVYAEGKHLVHDVGEAVHGGWEFVKGLFGGDQRAAPAGAGPAQAVQNALQWVTAFGKQVSAAVKQIERLMHGGRTKEAGDRVQALRAMSEQTRVEVTRAIQAAGHDPQLAKQAASARRHYLEIRAHLLQFVKGLHGLDLDSGGAGEGAPKGDRAHAPGSRTRKHHDPAGDLIDDILGGEDGRIHVDRGAARGDIHIADFQDIDPAALDTWIGSGEGVKLFSEVFGAFIPAEGAIVVHHRPRGGPGHAHGPQEPRGSRRKRGGFFARVFDRLEGFADRIAGWAKKGSTLLGKGMHYAELGMHGLSQVEGAAGKVQGMAGQAESFLEKMGLHTLAGYAGKIAGAAGWVDEEAQHVHGGLKKADRWMGEGKKVTGEVEHGAHAAAGILDKAAHGRFGVLANLFKASKTGDGIDGRLSPEKVGLGSTFDEPRRLDVTTISKMQSFLGGDFSGVRIHTGPGAAEVTRRFNAEAVTVKDHIFFAPGRFNPASVEGQKLIAHELTHVLQKGRANLDVRTAEGEALHSEHSYGHGPAMETLNLRRPEPGFRLAPDGEGMGASSGIHTARRTRSRGHEAGGKDALPDGDEFLEEISGRVYQLLMEELEHAFESR